MPSADALRNKIDTQLQEPSLTSIESEICRSYGGWTKFIISMRLRPDNSDDVEKGRVIIAAFAAEMEKDLEQEQKQKLQNNR
ncbi:hypothetical protein E4U30_002667 [Claviceps sp. LM220 group G6]|nr:hypothetical protein E4U31_007035 [Claviceps sp. LM219 group G6]KAG6101223.1 hypothetical protein E4U30_002667 [Claviceps sp. LM220 group G6]